MNELVTASKDAAPLKFLSGALITEQGKTTPRIEVEGYGAFDVPENTRLVRALEAHAVDILHRCGGYARCTTCRVEFIEGEPDRMTVAGRSKLSERGLLGQVARGISGTVGHSTQDYCVILRYHRRGPGATIPGP